MKYTTVKILEIRKHPTMRLDARYWIKKKKNVWGNKLVYPVCQDAIIFSYIAGTKTFCPITIANIKKLGYKFETQKEEI